VRNLFGETPFDGRFAHPDFSGATRTRPRQRVSPSGLDGSGAASLELADLFLETFGAKPVRNFPIPDGMIFHRMPGLVADSDSLAIHANRDELLQRHELADGCHNGLHRLRFNALTIHNRNQFQATSGADQLVACLSIGLNADELYY
jgi:hypothetical protein